MAGIPFIGDAFNVASIKSTAMMIGTGILIFIATIAITFGLMWLLQRKSKGKKVIEINLMTHRMRHMTGRWRKNADKVEMLYVGKLKKFIPRIQEEDNYLDKNKDTLILLKDNNGLHHTLRLPSADAIKDFYKNAYGITDMNEYADLKEVLDTIYFLPNPADNLEWLAGQTAEARETFSEVWWKHPNVMIIACAFICFLMVIGGMWISKKV